MTMMAERYPKLSKNSFEESESESESESEESDQEEETVAIQKHPVVATVNENSPLIGTSKEPQQQVQTTEEPQIAKQSEPTYSFANLMKYESGNVDQYKTESSVYNPTFGSVLSSPEYTGSSLSPEYSQTQSYENVSQSQPQYNPMYQVENKENTNETSEISKSTPGTAVDYRVVSHGPEYNPKYNPEYTASRSQSQEFITNEQVQITMQYNSHVPIRTSVQTDAMILSEEYNAYAQDVAQVVMQPPPIIIPLEKEVIDPHRMYLFHHPLVVLLASLIFPGLGHMFIGQVSKGIALLISFIILYALTLFSIYLIPIFILLTLSILLYTIFVLVDAFKLSRKLRNGSIIYKGECTNRLTIIIPRLLCRKTRIFKSGTRFDPRILD